MKVDFDSDIIGDVAAPGRKRRPLVVAAKQNTLRKIWNDISSRWCYHQHVSQTCTCIGAFWSEPMCAIPATKSCPTPSWSPLEQKKHITRRTGGCGLGGRDDPSLNGHPNVDIGEQLDVYDPRYSLYHSASLHPSAIDSTSTYKSPKRIHWSNNC